MLRKFAAGLMFFLLCVASLAGIAVLLPSREGVSISALPLYLGAVVALCLLGSLWSWAMRRSRKALVLGWLVVALPILMNGSVLVSLLAAEVEGSSLPSKIRIENYSETSLTWRGFEGPIGLKIEFELLHPAGMSAVVLAPELRMAPEPAIRRNRIANAFLDQRDELSYWSPPPAVRVMAMLREPVIQRMYPESAKSTVALAPDRTRVTYHLLPGTIDELVGDHRVCLASQSPGLPACERDQMPDAGCVRGTRPDVKRTRDGFDLSALWFAAGSYDLVANLSPGLTETLRRHSRLQGDGAAWVTMHAHLAPAGLARAGFSRCPPEPNTHSYARVCFCR